jgi:RHS repeat-associated protein
MIDFIDDVGLESGMDPCCEFSDLRKVEVACIWLAKCKDAWCDALECVACDSSCGELCAAVRTCLSEEFGRCLTTQETELLAECIGIPGEGCSCCKELDIAGSADGAWYNECSEDAGGTPCDCDGDGKVTCEDWRAFVANSIECHKLHNNGVGPNDAQLGWIICRFMNRCHDFEYPPPPVGPPAPPGTEASACVDTGGTECMWTLFKEFGGTISPDEFPLEDCVGVWCPFERERPRNPRPIRGPHPGFLPPGFLIGDGSGSGPIGLPKPGVEPIWGIVVPPVIIGPTPITPGPTPPVSSTTTISCNPVDLSSGDKIETFIDLSIPLAGIPFFLSREYTSSPDATGGNIGPRWTASVYRHIEATTTTTGEQSCCNLCAAGMAAGTICTTGCNESDCVESEQNVAIEGPTDQHFYPGGATINGVTYSTWNLVQPGQWEMSFFRERTSAIHDAVRTDPNEGLLGLIAQVRDGYGNRHDYLYIDHNGEVPGGYVLWAVNAYAAPSGTPAVSQLQAQIQFHYYGSADPESAVAGYLRTARVLRPLPGSEKLVPTHEVDYTYLEDDTWPHLGTAGDLVQVVAKERVDPAPGTDPALPTWRSKVTQYRYHTGAADEVSPTGGDNDGLLEAGGQKHQLKLIIGPEQVEFYAQKRASGSGGFVDTNVLSYTVDLMVLGDGVADAIAGLTPNQLASKIVTKYDEDGRVLREHVQTGCGCGGAGGTGMIQDFEYLAPNGADTMKSVRVTDRFSNGDVKQIKYVDLVRLNPTVQDGQWYIENEAITDAAETKFWVMHFERNPATENFSKICYPSATASYNRNGSLWNYSASTTEGLVAYLGHNNKAYVSSVALRQGDGGAAGATPVSRYTYDQDDFPGRAVKIERFAAPNMSGGADPWLDTPADAIETTEFTYTYHPKPSQNSSLVRGLKSVRTSEEAELPTENGPDNGAGAVTYSTWEFFDWRGLNHWSISADHVFTKRLFDNDDVGSGGNSVSRTGSAVEVTRNTAKPTGSGSPFSGLSGIPSTDRFADGGSLVTSFRRDLLGRLQKTISPSGVERITRREMRTASERPSLSYFATVSLPPEVDEDEYAGPASVSWSTAGGRTFAHRDYAVGAGGYTAGSGGDFRQVVTDYSLGGVLARSEIIHHPSGLAAASRAWHNATDDAAYYATAFEYDSLGRPTKVIKPNGTVTSQTYDFMSRVKEVSVSTSASGATPTVVSRSYYDSVDSNGVETEGVGNGNLTLIETPLTGGNARKTRIFYDWRNRVVMETGPLPPFSVQEYDNLDRVVRRGLFEELPSGGAIPSLTTFNSDRELLTFSFYSQRGVAYRQEVATEPSDAEPSSHDGRSVLATNRWFDQIGRAIASDSPNGPASKSTFDGLGRPEVVYVTDRAGDDDPGEGSFEDTYSLSTHAAVVTGDHILEQSEFGYVESGIAAGLLERSIHRSRVHSDDDDTGALTASGSINTFHATIYDAANRVLQSVEYGTNAATFSTGTTAPWLNSPIDQGTALLVTSGNDQRLTTTTAYNVRGLVDTVTDADGKVTRFQYDSLNRTVATIENYVDGAVTWSGTGWSASGAGTDDTDRVTSYVYDSVGNVVKQTAHNPTSGAQDQVTEYVYGVTTGSTSNIPSDLWTNDLLAKAIYPAEASSSPSVADRTVRYSYNSLGELKTVEDQNGTSHAYSRDVAGRIIRDAATKGSGSAIDDTIDEVGVAYDDLGRLLRVTSYLKADDSVANQVEFAYTPLWEVRRVYQNAEGAVAYATSGGLPDEPTGTTRLVRYEYDLRTFADGPASTGGAVNYSRGSALAYPRRSNSGSPAPAAEEFGIGYGTVGSVDDRISRVTSMGFGTGSTDPRILYEHLGIGTPVIVDYAAPYVVLDRSLGADGRRWDDLESGANRYRGFDRYGRIALQAWADGEITTTSSTPDGSGKFYPTVPHIYSVAHTYDEAGNRLTSHDVRTGNAWPMSQSHSYDGLDRLKESVRGINGTSWAVTAGSQRWELDPLGNWDKIHTDVNANVDSGNNPIYDSNEQDDRTHNDVNELTGRDLNGTTRDETLTYDKAGNLATKVVNGVTTTYTHDCWNRLVQVKVGSTRILEQEFNGLNWRTAKRADTGGSAGLDEERTFAYSAGWQLLEERVDSNYVSAPGTDKRVQYAWGKRYIDDCAFHRADVDNDGDYDGLWYHITDSMFSTVALLDEAGSLVERVTYTSYGVARHHWPADVTGDGGVNAADKSAITAALNTNTESSAYRAEYDINRDGVIDADDETLANPIKTALAAGLVSSAASGGADNAIGWDGYVFNAETALYIVRFRSYSPTTGRWLERDPAGHVDGLSLVEYTSSQATRQIDPSGLDGTDIKFDIMLRARGYLPPKEGCKGPKICLTDPEEVKFARRMADQLHEELKKAFPSNITTVTVTRVVQQEIRSGWIRVVIGDRVIEGRWESVREQISTSIVAESQKTSFGRFSSVFDKTMKAWEWAAYWSEFGDNKCKLLDFIWESVNSADAQEQYTSLVFALQASKELMPPGARAGLTSTLEALMYIKQLDLAADGGSGAPPFWDPASRQAWRELIEHLRECNGCTPERAPSTPGAATPPPAPASPTQTSTPKL